MKNIKYFIATIAVLVAFNACKNGANMSSSELKSVKIENGKDTFSYFMGLNISRFMKSKGLTEMNQAAFQKGIAEGFEKDSNYSIDDKVLRSATERYEMQAWKDLNQNIMDKNAKKEGIKTTESGLQYEIVKNGSGKKILLTDSLLVTYKISMANKEVFDMTMGKPKKIGVNSLFAGFQEALQLMSEGDDWILHIPSKLAFAERGLPRNQFSQGVMPFSMLKIEVQIVKILDGGIIPQGTK